MISLKVEPLKCPQCNSIEISPGFTKWKKYVSIRDGKIWCYNCKKVTDKNGKVKSHNYSNNRIDEELYEHRIN